MAGRHDFGRALARHLVAHTGIHDLRWEYAGSMIHAPRPYEIDVTGNRSSLALLAKVREQDKARLGAVISRIGAQRIEDSYVVMTLRSYEELLKAHYEAVALPRIQQGKE